MLINPYPYDDPDAYARARGDNFFVDCKDCGERLSLEFDEVHTTENQFGQESHSCEKCHELYSQEEESQSESDELTEARKQITELQEHIRFLQSREYHDARAEIWNH